MTSQLYLMGNGGRGEQYKDQVSGGRGHRVALARALAIESALLLLDEPFGALDAKVRKTLRIWLKELHDRIGLTSLFVTHDQDEAMEMADRVAVMRADRAGGYAGCAGCRAGECLRACVPGRGDPAGLRGLPGRGAVSRPAGGVRADGLPGGSGDRGDPALPDRPGRGAGSGGGAQSEPAHGPLQRVRVLVGGHRLEVLLLPAEGWMPAVGESCGLDLGRARVYPG